MSHPHELGGEVVEPVPVRIVRTDAERTQNTAPEFSSWESWAFTGTETVPVRVLGRNEKRSSAQIIVLAGGAGSIRIGGISKVGGGRGGLLNSGNSATVHGAPEVWVLPVAGNPVSVTVVDERYQ